MGMPTATTAPTKLRISDFTIPPGVDVPALTKGDADVTHVIARFEATSPAEATVLAKLHELASQARLNGTAGHQDKATLANEFRAVKVHWLASRLDGSTYSFLGIIDAAADNEKRWVKAGRLHVEPFLHGAAASLDLMPLDRGSRGVPAQVATEDGDSADTSSTSSTSGNGTTAPNGTAGEMHDANNVGLKVVRRSITPMGEGMGTYVAPISYDSDDTAAPNGTPTNEVMAGLTVRRRSL